MDWKEIYKLKNFQYQFLITVVLLVAALYFYSGFLDFIESRNGFTFNDPILRMIHPVDLTWLIFGVIYISLLSGIFILIKQPSQLLLALQVYLLLILVRIAAMYAVPFNPPQDMIPLKDPLVQLFGNGKVLTKDSFLRAYCNFIFIVSANGKNHCKKNIFYSYNYYSI